MGLLTKRKQRFLVDWRLGRQAKRQSEPKPRTNVTSSTNIPSYTHDIEIVSEGENDIDKVKIHNEMKVRMNMMKKVDQDLKVAVKWLWKKGRALQEI